ncbi:AsmA-like C-terminal region-containing protein [Acidicapsa dinghuensis]|uniref:AsmA-like C-terminal region-containing protein n=1 Tax=Acidicapsa dinghuensis TaxID=2218256 RepID=A0ABW1EAU1_9BACT|nr:AsmA-like C-terminal region-containing protein [Acidicapsa dinghuensis]
MTEPGMGPETNPETNAEHGSMEPATVPPAAATPGAPRRRRRWTRWLMWVGICVAVILVVLGVIVAVLLERAQPMLKAALIDALEKRFHAKVELDDLRVSVMNGYEVEGRGLRIWLPKQAVDELSAENAATTQPKPSPSGKTAAGQTAAAEAATMAAPTAFEAWRTEPWIVVQQIKFRATWEILSGKPINIPVIHVVGVRVILPPKAERPHLKFSDEQKEAEADAQSQEQPMSPDNNTPADNSSSGKSKLFKIPAVMVRRVECSGALLEITRAQQPGKPAKVPLDFTFQNIVVIPDLHGGPMGFTVDMVNAKPVGDIHSTGKAGPWTAGDPGALPVEGDYSFKNADLSTIKGIAGTLSSTGHYEGTLRAITADGDTRTPDFRLERVSPNAGELLTTHYHALIDGTNGDTWLQPVNAMLGNTHILAKGKVVRAEDATGQKHGHDIQLDVTVDRGNIEDILKISADQQTPFVIGNLTLHTDFHLPPGQQNVIDKLELNGQFHLAQAKFTSDKIQGRIEELSLRGQGKPDEVKSTDPTTVLSEMQGHFKLGDGQLDLPDLDYNVPGAEIKVHGSYGMQQGSLNFQGDAKLQASLSQVVGGWKGFLLKPVDPLLHKNGAGTDVPIHVEGTRQDPKFGVDFGRIGKTDKTNKTEDQPSPQ